MSVKIFIWYDTIKEPIEGYIFNDDAYEIREQILEAKEKYQKSKEVSKK